MSDIINGRKIAKIHGRQIIQRLNELKARDSGEFRDPIVVSFCNQEDLPSVNYTGMKQQKAAELGIDFRAEIFSAQTSRDELAAKIQQYNNDPLVDGIMVQLPLPESLNLFKGPLIELIDPRKDVDGLTEKGRLIYIPATVKAVLTILDEACPQWGLKHLAVVGSKGEVGRSLVECLEARKVANLAKIDMNQGDINTDLSKADIVISATGQEGLVKPEMIRNGIVLIDVGLGDFDPKCYKKASFYTPRIGGVGPVTVVSLMENVIEAYKNKSEYRNPNLETN